MGTRTYSRRGINGVRVLTALGRQRQQTMSVQENVTPFSLGITKHLDDWSTYPRGSEQMFNDGIQTVTAYLETDEQFRDDFFRDYLGLNPDNEEHVAVAAALMGITSGYELQYDTEYGSVVTLGEDSSGNVTILPSSNGTVSVDINTFGKLASSRRSRLAYSMIRRMVWGIRRYAEINGVLPSGRIYLQAESDDGGMNGVETWAKLGFNMNLGANELGAAARSFGFDATSSNELMQEKNSSGNTGVGLWDDIVRQVIDKKGSASADGTFIVGPEYTNSQNVLDRYGQT